jgi:uncharacterized protein YgbK (DUF1537 family)
VSVAEMRRAGSAAAIAARRTEGWTIVVGDAASDADLDDWLAGLPGGGTQTGRDPIVLVGSTGLAKAWRRQAGSQGASLYAAQIRRVADPMVGVLVVAGSAHPATRAQLDYERQQGRLVHVVPALDAPQASAVQVAQCLAQGRDVCLSAPLEAVPGGSGGVLDALASVAAAALERTRPAAMILIGGETAFHVLGRLDHPRLIVEGEPAPLAVRAVVVDGPHVGMAIVTKGGSSGPPDRLRALIRAARR